MNVWGFRAKAKKSERKMCGRQQVWIAKTRFLRQIPKEAIITEIAICLHSLPKDKECCHGNHKHKNSWARVHQTVLTQGRARLFC
jgi:hypothetical protein